MVPGVVPVPWASFSSAVGECPADAPRETRAPDLSGREKCAGTPVTKPLRDLVHHGLVVSGWPDGFDVHRRAALRCEHGGDDVYLGAGVVVRGVRGAGGVAVASQRPENAQLDASGYWAAGTLVGSRSWTAIE